MKATQKEIDKALSLLAEADPVLPDVHPRQRIKGTDYPVLPFRESFQAFADQREKLLITLRKPSFDDWSRAGMSEDANTPSSHKRGGWQNMRMSTASRLKNY